MCLQLGLNGSDCETPAHLGRQLAYAPFILDQNLNMMKEEQLWSLMRKGNYKTNTSKEVCTN